MQPYKIMNIRVITRVIRRWYDRHEKEKTWISISAAINASD